MSRTYRKRSYYMGLNECLKDNFVREDEIVWEDVESVKPHLEYGWFQYNYYTVTYRANSKSGKLRLAKGRRDRVDRFKEPGPGWFRNLFSDRPYRRRTKMALDRYVKYGAETYHTDYEPVIEAMPKLPYWT